MQKEMEKIIIPLKKGKARKLLQELQRNYPKYLLNAYVLGHDSEAEFDDELLLLLEGYKHL